MTKHVCRLQFTKIEKSAESSSGTVHSCQINKTFLFQLVSSKHAFSKENMRLECDFLSGSLFKLLKGGFYMFTVAFKYCYIFVDERRKNEIAVRCTRKRSNSWREIKGINSSQEQKIQKSFPFPFLNRDASKKEPKEKEAQEGQAKAR